MQRLDNRVEHFSLVDVRVHRERAPLARTQHVLAASVTIAIAIAIAIAIGSRRRGPWASELELFVAHHCLHHGRLAPRDNQTVAHLELNGKPRVATEHRRVVCGREQEAAAATIGEIAWALDGDGVHQPSHRAHEPLTHTLCRSEEAQVKTPDGIHHHKGIEELVGVRRTNEERWHILGWHLELISHSDLAEEYFDDRHEEPARHTLCADIRAYPSEDQCCRNCKAEEGRVCDWWNAQRRGDG